MALRTAERIPVISTYCVWIQYFPEVLTIRIGYHDGEVWDYFPFDMRQAYQFATASSKGTWAWDNIRVRGTRHTHHCVAVRLA